MTSSARLAAVLRDPERVHLRAGTVTAVTGGRVSVDLGGVVIGDLPVAGHPIPAVGARAIVLATAAQAVVLPAVAVPTPPTYTPVQTMSAVNQTITTATFTGTGIGHAFVAPPSGIVRIAYYYFLGVDIAGSADQKTRQIWGSFRIGTGATVGAGTEILAPATTRSISLLHQSMVGGGGMNGRLAAGANYLLTGLTPDTTYNIAGSAQITSTDVATNTVFVQRFSTDPHLG